MMLLIDVRLVSCPAYQPLRRVAGRVRRATGGHTR